MNHRQKFPRRGDPVVGVVPDPDILVKDLLRYVRWVPRLGGPASLMAGFFLDGTVHTMPPIVSGLAWTIPCQHYPVVGVVPDPDILVHVLLSCVRSSPAFAGCDPTPQNIHAVLFIADEAEARQQQGFILNQANPKHMDLNHLFSLLAAWHRGS